MNSEKLIRIENPPRTVDLARHGFAEAGKNGGNVTSFINQIESIYVGSLLDKSIHVGRTQEQVEQIRNNIEVSKSSIIKSENDIKGYRAEIERIKIKIEELKDRLDSYLSGGLNSNSVGAVIDTPSRARTIISSFFLVMLSIFIFLFYVAVVYKALFVSTASIAQALANGDWGISLLPEWKEVQEAIGKNTMVIFAPFIFYGFGYAIHILLELENKFKYLLIGLVLIVTFVLDYLLALQIHNKLQEANNLMGVTGSDKFEDIILVLIMGFVVYIIWSIIFHYWMGEIEKWNISSRLGRLIRNKEKEKEDFEKKITGSEREIAEKKGQIQQLESSITMNEIPISEIIKSITLFTSGWFNFLSGLGDDKLMDECKQKLDMFKQQRQLDFNLKL